MLKEGLRLLRKRIRRSTQGCLTAPLPRKSFISFSHQKKIAEQLVRIGKHPYLNHTALKVVKPQFEEEGDDYRNIMALLKLAFNVNFSGYKESTINRRISRRMVIHQIEKAEDYVKLLRSDRGALQALFDDLLIGVTSFFREPETFQVLAEKVYPVILKDRSPQATIRVWVPGCATGEEVYSLAVSLREFMEKTGSITPIQIFGTDISDKNIEKARAGVYQDSISEHVSEERLKHFFSKIKQKYQIDKSIRDMCVFAKQDLTRDPPFSNLDLISCRNVLIYLRPEAQKRVIPIFHYALKPNGFLVLGKSESIGGYEELFSPIEKTPVYLKKIGQARIPLEIEVGDLFRGRQALKKQPNMGTLDVLQKEVERVLTSKFSPPGVVVNNELNVLLFRGNTSQFLLHGPGEASLDLMKMLRDELKLELQTAIFLARKENESVKREGIQFKHNRVHSQVDIEVIPIASPQLTEKFFLVLFESVSPLARGREKTKTTKEDVTGSLIEELKHELSSTKETLRRIIEEQESTNEELRAALEEVQSSNEELQSTNEELETAKEELQSTNEELTTVNDEVTRQNRELGRSHDDLTNLFGNIDVTVIVLDPALKIRLYTPEAEKKFNLIESDIGRPISDISLGIAVQNFEGLLREALERFSFNRMEIQDKKGEWYEMRLRPYLTADKKIDGVVLSFIDIDALLRNKVEIEKSRNLADTILATMVEPLVVLNDDLKLERANLSFYKTFEIDESAAKHQPISSIVDLPWNATEFKKAMQRVLANGEAITDLVVDRDFPKIGRRVMNLNVRQLSQDIKGSKMILVTFRDITHEKQIEEGLLKSKQELEQLVEDRTKKLQDVQRLATIGQTAAMVGHDIRNPLQSIVSASYLIKEETADMSNDKRKKSMMENLETIDEQTQYIDKIVSDLQEYSKPLDPRSEETDLQLLIKSRLARVPIPKNIEVDIQIESLPKIKTDQTCLARILTNLFINSVQAMPDGGRITIKANKENGNAVLTVEDTGIGVPEEAKSKIFQPLFTTKSKGQGFGLAVCKRLAEALKGDITFESEKGKGTKFTIKLPIEK